MFGGIAGQMAGTPAAGIANLASGLIGVLPGLAGGGGSSFITNLGGLIINTIAGGAFSGPNASSSTPPTTGHGSIIISFTASGGGGGIISAIPETYSFNFNSYTQYSAIFSPTSSNISVPT